MDSRDADFIGNDFPSIGDVNESLDQGFKFRSVPTETVGIFRSVPKIGTEHVMKNFALCTALFLSESPELPESGRYTYSGRNRGIDFSVLKFICLFCIFLY